MAPPTSIPPEIKAMGFDQIKGDAKLLSYAPKPLAKNDVDFVVTYNGICHSDIHMIDNDWGMTRLPLIPGHEVVGHVLAVGSAVTDIAPGDVVGLGAQCQTCKECDYCKQGIDNVCADRAFTYMATTKDELGEHIHHGGFSSFLRTDGRMLYKVPDGLEEKYVGPLMCAGATIFEPIHHFFGGLDGTGKTVGVVGIGGLGHLAVQFAHKMGAKVIALSRGTNKEGFAKQLGADSLLDTTNDDAMAAAAGTIDLLIFTTAGGNIDVNKYLPLMKPYGNVHFCGVPDENLSLNVMPIIFGRLSLSGNPVCGANDMRIMLQFAADHDVKPIIEVFAHSQANEAIAKVRDGSIRFRAVLKNDLIEQ